MSLSVSGISFTTPNFGADSSASSASPANSASTKSSTSNKSNTPDGINAPAIPIPTLSQQLQQLANAGLSNEQIATSLGLTLTQVLSSLHETTASTRSSASDLVSLSARLSVTV